VQHNPQRSQQLLDVERLAPSESAEQACGERSDANANYYQL
jgi:hypothetical protein